MAQFSKENNLEQTMAREKLFVSANIAGRRMINVCVLQKQNKVKLEFDHII